METSSTPPPTASTPDTSPLLQPAESTVATAGTTPLATGKKIIGHEWIPKGKREHDLRLVISHPDESITRPIYHRIRHKDIIQPYLDHLDVDRPEDLDGKPELPEPTVTQLSAYEPSTTQESQSTSINREKIKKVVTERPSSVQQVLRTPQSQETAPTPSSSSPSPRPPPSTEAEEAMAYLRAHETFAGFMLDGRRSMCSIFGPDESQRAAAITIELLDEAKIHYVHGEDSESYSNGSETEQNISASGNLGFKSQGLGGKSTLAREKEKVGKYSSDATRDAKTVLIAKARIFRHIDDLPYTAAFQKNCKKSKDALYQSIEKIVMLGKKWFDSYGVYWSRELIVGGNAGETFSQAGMNASGLGVNSFLSSGESGAKLGWANLGINVNANFSHATAEATNVSFDKSHHDRVFSNVGGAHVGLDRLSDFGSTLGPVKAWKVVQHGKLELLAEVLLVDGTDNQKKLVGPLLFCMAMFLKLGEHRRVATTGQSPSTSPFSRETSGDVKCHLGAAMLDTLRVYSDDFDLDLRLRLQDPHTIPKTLLGPDPPSAGPKKTNRITNKAKEAKKSLCEAAECGDLMTVQLLLDQASDAQVRDSSGKTPLRLACEGAHLEVVQLLLNHGATLSLDFEERKSLLYIVASKGHSKLFQLLVKHWALRDVKDKDGQTLLHIASKEGYLETVRMLVECNADLEARDEKQRTPLLSACRGSPFYLFYNIDSCSYPWIDQLAVVEFLIQSKANLEATVGWWEAPLGVALQYGYLPLANVLVKNGASLEANDADVWTLLQTASLFGKLDAVRFLVENGANIQAGIRGSSTPLKLAMDSKECGSYKEVLAFLKAKGATE